MTSRTPIIVLTFTTTDSGLYTNAKVQQPSVTILDEDSIATAQSEGYSVSVTLEGSPPGVTVDCLSTTFICTITAPALLDSSLAGTSFSFVATVNGEQGTFKCNILSHCNL